jgi:hypothetical protein
VASGVTHQGPPGLRERETGIEPALLAWKASALPLSYSRTYRIGEAGFEPAASASRTLRANQAALLSVFPDRIQERTPSGSHSLQRNNAQTPGTEHGEHDLLVGPNRGDGRIPCVH